MDSIYIKRKRLQNFYDELIRKQNQLVQNLEEVSKPLRMTEWNDNVYDICKERLNIHIKSINDLLDQIETAKEFVNDTLDKFDEYIKLSGVKLKF